MLRVEHIYAKYNYQFFFVIELHRCERQRANCQKIFNMFALEQVPTFHIFNMYTYNLIFNEKKKLSSSLSICVPFNPDNIRPGHLAMCVCYVDASLGAQSFINWYSPTYLTQMGPLTSFRLSIHLRIKLFRWGHLSAPRQGRHEMTSKSWHRQLTFYIEHFITEIILGHQPCPTVASSAAAYPSHKKLHHHHQQ